MPVVTIARETGAGGTDVGRLLAARLGVDLVDGSLIDEVARRLQLPRAEVADRDEQPSSTLERLLRGLALAQGPIGVDASLAGDVPGDPHDAIVALTAEAIREAARSANTVIVGRGAGFVLANLPGAVHVFLCAPIEVRVRRLTALWNVDEATARRRLQADDAKRRAYVREVHDREWRDPLNYDLAIDTGRVGFEDAAELILLLVAQRTATADRSAV
jgi:cytidylate kinase